MAARVLVVIPAYNEGAMIADVVAAVRAALPQASVLVVDDGSRDTTAAWAGNAGALVLRLPFNLGIGGAVQTGLLYAERHGFENVLQVDGDGQHDPSEAPRLLQALRDGADLALGTRWRGRGSYAASPARRLGMRLLAALTRWRTGRPWSDTTSGFRALGPAAIALFARTYPADFPEVESLVLAVRRGLRVAEVPVAMVARRAGRSSIAGLRAPYYMLRVGLGLLADALRGVPT